jgi:nicotine blue oxidoreductase
MHHTAGLVLAAGAGSRLGEPKAPLVVAGERLVDRMVRVLAEAGCSPVVVVLGAWQGDVPHATVLINDAWPSGMGSSLRVGLTWLTQNAEDIDRVAITPVDLPGLTVPAVKRLLNCPAAIAAGAFDGVRGHPVLLARTYWSAVLNVCDGDRGARDFLASRSDLVLIELGDLADGTDLDTPVDLTQLRNQFTPDDDAGSATQGHSRSRQRPD